MIYLDHAAATPVHPEVLAAMQPFWSEQFFNPSSPYLAARAVRLQFNQAKDVIAHTIGAKGNDLIMTSGATEATNLAFTAINQGESCLISALEHPSVRAAAAPHSPIYLPVSKQGLIDLDFAANQLAQHPELSFISVTLADGEVGTIQPLAQLGQLVKQERLRRLAQQNPTPLFLHADASQALTLLDFSVARLGLDLVTLSAAKAYGMKGIGALYASSSVPLKPLIAGGGQEAGLRSGTENIAGAVGFAKALQLAREHLKTARTNYQSYKQLLRQIIAETVKYPPVFLGNPKTQLANFCPVSFPGLDAERLIFALDARGVYLSTGAACSASKGAVSPVLTALGLSETLIAGALRITFGNTNNETQIATAGRLISEVVNQEWERLGA